MVPSCDAKCLASEYLKLDHITAFKVDFARSPKIKPKYGAALLSVFLRPVDYPVINFKLKFIGLNG